VKRVPKKKRRKKKKPSSSKKKKATKKKATTTKPRPKKKKKDPNAPKKPTTGYAFYLKDKRVEFQNQYPTLKFGELSKKIAAAWKALTPENKKDYQDKYEEDKKRYTKAMETYQKPSTESEDSSDSSKKKKKKEEERKKEKRSSCS